MKDIFQHINELFERREDFALATIFSRSGSAPRTSGARMVIHANGSIYGTIGGGLLEAQVLQSAPQIFSERGALIREFSLSGKDASQTDMICGGNVAVLIEFIDAGNNTYRKIFQEALAAINEHRRVWLLTELPPSGELTQIKRRCLLKQDGSTVGKLSCTVEVGLGSPIGLFGDEVEEVTEQPDITSSRSPVVVRLVSGERLLVEPICDYGTVYIFGAGHVSQKLAPLCSLVGFETVVIDDRAEYANRERFPSADRILVVQSYQQCFDELPIDEDSYLVIVTRGHLNDSEVLERAMRTRAGYIGMIGSKRKRDEVYKHLVKTAGFRMEDFSRVNSPIGIPIGAESPEEIAVSIVAELIQARAKRK